MSIELNACPWDPLRLELISTPERAWLILDLLLQQGEKTLATMEASACDTQAEQWRRAAHGLAGSAANLGMERLAGCCLEDPVRTATEAQRSALREGIRSELARIAAYKHSLEH